MLLLELDKVIGNPAVVDGETQIFIVNFAGMLGYSLIPILILTVIMYYASKAFSKIKIQSTEDQKSFVLDNKAITKIIIVIFFVWLIISFIGTDGGSRRFKLEEFLVLQIPPILIFGYLWISNKFTIK